MRKILFAAVAAVIMSTPALADPPPPAGSLSLSQIVAKVEAHPDFAYFDSIDWDDGLYEVEYRTKDGARRELWLDPRTGEPRK